jgi:hypothetical protein
MTSCSSFDSAMLIGSKRASVWARRVIQPMVLQACGLVKCPSQEDMQSEAVHLVLELLWGPMKPTHNPTSLGMCTSNIWGAGGLEWGKTNPHLLYSFICNLGLCTRVDRLSHSHHLSLSFPFGAISSSVRQQQLAIIIGHTF